MNNWETRGYFCLVLAHLTTNNWIAGAFLSFAIINFIMWVIDERRELKAMKRRIEILKSMANGDFNEMTKK